MLTVRLDVLAHQLDKDGYDHDLIDEIIEALRIKKEFEDFKVNVKS